MKKLALLLAILTILTTLSACSGSEDTRITGVYNGKLDEAVLTTGESWFQKSGLVTGMSQFAFQDWLGTLSYEGKSLTEKIAPQFIYDDSGRGFRGNSLDFNYSCITASTLVDGKTSFSYTLTARVPLDGLTLPWDLELGNTLSESLTKMGIDVDLAAEFKPDVEGYPDMTVLTNDSGTFLFTNYEANEQMSEYIYQYSLTFSYKSSYEKIDGTDVEAISTITLSYDLDGKLCTVLAGVQELFDPK